MFLLNFNGKDKIEEKFIIPRLLLLEFFSRELYLTFS